MIIKPKRKFTAGAPTTSDIAEGEIAINTADKKLYVRDNANNIVEIGGGGSASGATTDVTQSSHGFAVKDCIRHTGSAWTKARANSNSTLALGVVTAVADSNTFTVAQSGRFELTSHGLTVGQWYYLSSSSAGALTATEPTISQPLVYVESANFLFVYPYRPTNLLVSGSASVVPGDNTVTSAKIVDGTIVTADLADDAITSAKIADDAITSALIADDAVVTAAIADDAITSALIADDAITSALIADDAITSALIADDAVVQAAIADDAVNEARLQVSNSPTNGYFLSAQSGNTGGLTWAEAVSGTSWDMTVKTANFTAVAGNGYLVNTTGGAFTVTLPASPSNGDIVEIKDVAGTADTNNISIARNGSKINGEDVTKKLHDERITVTLLFTGSTYGWVTIGDSNNTTSPWNTETVAVEFLTLAGGGAGGKAIGGGGGAGGYIASTSASIDKGVAYTVTVGAGGAGSTSSSSYGGNGGNSSFAGTTAIGGGSGSNAGSETTNDGQNGGSGGGGTDLGGTGTSGQGNNGGTYGGSQNGGNFNRAGGGGGGAGAAGGNAGGSYTPGVGGNGSASSITGSSVTRAGGGGGSLYGYFGNTTGAGGSGGGGLGGSNNTEATNGGVNLGGGGGGACYQYNPYDANNGTNGGSGIVIIKVLTSLYSGTTSGSPTVTTSGSHTILQFTSSGTYTP